eukprot:8143359-Alexandrium_andersonii.AAC.1
MWRIWRAGLTRVAPARDLAYGLASGAQSLHCPAPRRPRNWSPKLSRGAVCTAVRGDSRSAYER